MFAKKMFAEKYILLIVVLIAVGIYVGYSRLRRAVVSHQPKRVYVDMVADLFHYGHVNFLRQAKEHGDYLIVGICSDEDAASYKRPPIMNLTERAKLIESCKYVDEVIVGCPLKLTKEFIQEHKIDLVLHGDDWPATMLAEYYGVPMELGIFKTIPYTRTISTTTILQRVHEYFSPNEHAQDTLRA